MCMLRKISNVLLVIGGLNWGLVGINSSWNVVQMIFGMGTVTNVIYWLVGLGALVEICHWIGICKCDCCTTSMPIKK